MKAISLWQPWASLWACGRKRYETRHWETRHTGMLIVHAAKRIETDISGELRDICIDEFGTKWQVALPAGALIAVCDRVLCKPCRLVSGADPEERAQGNFGPGRYVWDPVNMRELPAPIPWRGMQSLFDVPDHIIGAEPPPEVQGTLL